MRPQRSLSSPAVGDIAPPLRLPRLDGTGSHAGDARDRPFLVSFLRHAG